MSRSQGLSSGGADPETEPWAVRARGTLGGQCVGVRDPRCPFSCPPLLRATRACVGGGAYRGGERDRDCVPCPLRGFWALPSAPGPWRVMACPHVVCAFRRPWCGWDQRHTWVQIEGSLVCLRPGGRCAHGWCRGRPRRAGAVTLLSAQEPDLSLPRLPAEAFRDFTCAEVETFTVSRPL